MLEGRGIGVLADGDREASVARHLGAHLAGLAGLAALVLLSAFPSTARAEPGVFPDRIVFGQAAALDGRIPDPSWPAS